MAIVDSGHLFDFPNTVGRIDERLAFEVPPAACASRTVGVQGLDQAGDGDRLQQAFGRSLQAPETCFQGVCCLRALSPLGPRRLRSIILDDVTCNETFFGTTSISPAVPATIAIFIEATLGELGNW